MDWRVLVQWAVMVVLAAALGLAVLALLGMGAVIAIGMAGADVLGGLLPLLLTAGVTGGLLWWLTRRGWGRGWWLLFSGRQVYTHWDSLRDAEEEQTDLNLPPRRPSGNARGQSGTAPRADNDPAPR